jgi:hypothetical protein
MNDDTPIPRFLDAPAHYDRQYMSVLTLQLVQAFKAILSRGSVSVDSLTLHADNLPTSPSGLAAGTIYVDNGTLKIVQAVGMVEPTGVSVTASVGSVTVVTT